MRAFALPVAMLCLASAIAGCGGDDPPTAIHGAGVAAGTNARDDGTQRRVPVGTPLEALERSKPRVPRGPTTGDLIARDIVRGTGAVAENGDILLVRYVAGVYETGEEIEFAGRREPVGFLLGSGDWSLGFEAGMPGMRVGGRRELIFPTTPDALPPGSELGDTLVYVVDLLGITEPGG